MAEDQERLKLEGLIKKLRSVTLAVQILPFIYAFLYILAMVAYLLCSDIVSIICDHLFYVSVCVIVYNLILSKTLRLCNWHRASCLVPLIPELVGLADSTIIDLSEVAVKVNIFTIIAMILILLICAHHVFFKH